MAITLSDSFLEHYGDSVTQAMRQGMHYMLKPAQLIDRKRFRRFYRTGKITCDCGHHYDFSKRGDWREKVRSNLKHPDGWFEFGCDHCRIRYLIRRPPRRRLLFAEISQNCYSPWWLGMCWAREDRRTYYVALIPFNLVMIVLRELYVLVKNPPASLIWRRLAQCPGAFMEGWRRGRGRREPTITEAIADRLVRPGVVGHGLYDERGDLRGFKIRPIEDANEHGPILTVDRTI